MRIEQSVINFCSFFEVSMFSHVGANPCRSMANPKTDEPNGLCQKDGGYGPALQILARAGSQHLKLYTRIERKHRAAIKVAIAEGSLIRKDTQPGDP
jgi:hypothetical protein